MNTCIKNRLAWEMCGWALLIERTHANSFCTLISWHPSSPRSRHRHQRHRVVQSIQSSGARQLHCFRAAGAASPSCARNQSPHTLPVSYTLSDRHRSIIFDIIIVVIIVMIIVIIIVTTSVISVIATIIVIIVLICAQPSPNLRCAVISPKLSSHN